jgi:tetratricopeptide (TPR) repeat protein
MKRLRWELASFALALVVSAGAIHCAKQEAAPAQGSAAHAQDAGAPFDIEVMAFLSQARALHHQANIQEDSGDLPGAIAAMERLTHAKLPHPGRKVPEVEEVLADAFARLAELRLRANDVAGADGAVREGLAHAPDATYFRGHLLEVQGILEETRAATLADAGKNDEAAKARAKAIALLQEAVRVQEQVVERALGDGGRR